ncbi:MAG: hypothetical protein DRH57_08900 [Candidatus Cloacimonadota bacterium]|nr:MAG: hypothetical protein DRH57_08900 [Candidatus Cloacimonadota bacterium]
MDEQREQLEYLKENYTVESLITAQCNNDIDVETMILPTAFKRLGFVLGEVYKVGESDFYGNRNITSEQPKLLSSIALMTIHKLVEDGYDRYGVIMRISDMCIKSTSTEELVDSIAELTA